jgi:hypothetical protein
MKKKLKLNDIKVKSFVTEMDKAETRTIQGGDQSLTPACNTEVAACINTNAYFCPIHPSAYDACPTVFSCGACTSPHVCTI